MKNTKVDFAWSTMKIAIVKDIDLEPIDFQEFQSTFVRRSVTMKEMASNRFFVKTQFSTLRTTNNIPCRQNQYPLFQ